MTRSPAASDRWATDASIGCSVWAGLLRENAVGVRDYASAISGAFMYLVGYEVNVSSVGEEHSNCPLAVFGAVRTTSSLADPCCGSQMSIGKLARTPINASGLGGHRVRTANESDRLHRTLLLRQDGPTVCGQPHAA